MGIFKSSFFINLFCLFIIVYLIYHTLHGQYNIQNRLVYDFEKKLFEDFNYNLKQSLADVNKDIYALHYEFDDMVDEVAKRRYPILTDGEVLIKLD